MSSVYDRFDHMRRSLFWADDVLVMATSKPQLIEVQSKSHSAYFDDSGKKTTPLVFAGGWLGRVERWALLQQKWIPKVTADGSKELKRSNYDYKRRGDEFLFQLEDLVRQYTLYGFAIGIYTEDWRKVADEYALELYHLVPFSICARTCIGMVREWCFKNKIAQEQMAYFMDRGSEDSGELTQLLNIDMSQEVRDVTVIPEDSKRIAAIQASDFLSWEIRNQYLTNPDPQDWDELTPVLERLIKGRYWAFSSPDKIPKWGIYREADLRKLCESAKIPLKKDVPPAIWNRPKPIRLKLPVLKP